MVDWATWCQKLRQQVDAADGHRVDLTIERIRVAAGAHRLNIERPWWWILACDPNVVGNDVHPAAYGLDCRPNIEHGRVISVTFTLKR
jgi:hypothetical protein